MAMLSHDTPNNGRIVYGDSICPMDDGRSPRWRSWHRTVFWKRFLHQLPRPSHSLFRHEQWLCDDRHVSHLRRQDVSIYVQRNDKLRLGRRNSMKRPTSCGRDGQPCGRALKGAPLDKFDDSVPPEKKQCVQCWNALNSPVHQRLWGIPVDAEGQVILDALPPRTGNCCGGAAE